MTGENTDCRSGKVKTAPIYQIEAYQKTLPKVKHIDITQKSQIAPNNWKTSNYANKPQQNLKKIVKHSSKHCSIKNWVFQSTRLKRTKRPTQSETYQHHSKIPNFSSQLENIESLQKKPNKI